MRLIQHDYFEINELPVGEIPFTAIQNAIKKQEYLLKFTPTNYREDFLVGHTGALLYWYPEYIDILYELSINDQEFMLFFKPFPTEIRDGFVYLFPEVKRRLNKIRKKFSKLNHLEEWKL